MKARSFVLVLCIVFIGVALSLIKTEYVNQDGLSHPKTRDYIASSLPKFHKQERVAREHVKQKISGIDIPFIANQGQIDSRVKFYARTFGGTVFVTNEGDLLYSLPKVEAEKPNPLSDLSPAMERRNFTAKSKPFDGVYPEQGRRTLKRVGNSTHLKGLVLKEELADGKFNEVRAEGETITKVSYLIGNDRSKWKSNISAHEIVTFGEVYEGVQLKLRAYGNNVEKLFYVKPGAEPDQIRIRLSGGKLNVNKHGELEVGTQLGTVKFTKPVAYQEKEGKRKFVEVVYVVKGDEYGFKVGEYDKGKELVIDPILAATFLGGCCGEFSPTLALDGTGNVYVTGVTDSSDFPGISIQASADNTFAGGIEAFVAKLNPNLSSILAATFLGGSSGDSSSALALDGAGNVYVAGKTSSSDFPGIGPESAVSTFAEPEAAFVAKLNPNLSSILAATFLGRSGNENHVNASPLALALDGTGNVYVTGETFSSDFPGISIQGSADGTFVGFNETFVAKLNPNLSSILAATFLGGSDHESSSALALDGAGNAYVAGSTGSSDFPGIGIQGSADDTFAGGREAFVAKLDSNLSSILAATFLGGSGSETLWPLALALDGTGNIYVTGETFSSDFPGVGQGSVDSTFAGLSEAFAAKLDSNLSSILAATFLGGSASEDSSGVALDGAGNLYVAGFTGSSDFPGISIQGSADGTFAGLSEGFVAKLDSNLSSILAATFFGGSGSEGSFNHGLALDGTGNVYVGGHTLFSDFPGISIQGSADGTFAGGREAFVAKLDPDLSSILDLLTHFKEFVDSCIPCPPEPIRTLINKIQLAISHFEKGQERPMLNALRSFVHKTEQFVTSGKLPEAEGRLFITMAEEIISAAEAQSGQATPER
jgi:hypothetical protein